MGGTSIISISPQLPATQRRGSPQVPATQRRGFPQVPATQWRGSQFDMFISEIWRKTGTGTQSRRETFWLVPHSAKPIF